MIILISAIIFFFIGYFIGRGKDIRPEISVTADDVVEKIRGYMPKKDEIGPVERPTARDVEIYKNPKLAEEDRIMTEAFDNIVKQ